MNILIVFKYKTFIIIYELQSSFINIQIIINIDLHIYNLYKI